MHSGDQVPERPLRPHRRRAGRHARRRRRCGSASAASARRLGGILGPFEAWLLTRGMRTLYPLKRSTGGLRQRALRHPPGHLAQHPAGFRGSVLYPGSAVLPRRARRRRPADARRLSAECCRSRVRGALALRSDTVAAATAANVALEARDLAGRRGEPGSSTAPVSKAQASPAVPDDLAAPLRRHRGHGQT